MMFSNVFLWPTLILNLFSGGQSNKKNDTSSLLNRDNPKMEEIKIIPIKTKNGTFNVWTHRVGNNPKIKVLLLAGGPGLSHDYLSCIADYFPQEDIEFIFYDQLGCGKSDIPSDSSLYSVERSVEELETVRKALHLTKDNFFLYGHSWGAVVAMEYAVKYQKNLKALVVSNMTYSGQNYNKYIDEQLAPQMPPLVVDAILKLEAANAYEDPSYMDLVSEHFYTKHVCRMPLESWPKPVLQSLGGINHVFYTIMQGPSEFGIKGKLKDWSIAKRISKITVPSLFIGAKYDTMNPKDLEWMSAQIINGSFLLCPNGSHLALYDDQKFYMAGLVDFIKKTAAKK
jgi:proline iminopeptidase